MEELICNKIHKMLNDGIKVLENNDKKAIGIGEIVIIKSQNNYILEIGGFEYLSNKFDFNICIFNTLEQARIEQVKKSNNEKILQILNNI